MKADKWYHDNAQVESAIWEIINEHPGATRSEVIAYAKERGIPRYYVLGCLKHSVVIEKARDNTRATRHYARNREEVDREIQQKEAEWLNETLQAPGRKTLLFECGNCGHFVHVDIDQPVVS